MLTQNVSFIHKNEFDLPVGKYYFFKCTDAPRPLRLLLQFVAITYYS